jgi:hypothetical protein
MTFWDWYQTLQIWSAGPIDLHPEGSNRGKL